jgi:hypothetical protein
MNEKSIIENQLNEVINDSYDMEEDEIRNTIININCDIEIKERKLKALKQMIEVAESVCCYGDLDGDIYKLKASLEDVEAEIQFLKEDMDEIVRREDGTKTDVID